MKAKERRVSKMRDAAPREDQLKKPQERMRREARRQTQRLRRLKNRRF